jgi:DNA-binding NtrC family response regulator
VEDLPETVRRAEGVKTGDAAAAAVSMGAFDAPPSLEDHEKELLADALEKAGGNQSEAARILRISRDRMRYKMAKHNLR